MRGDVTITAHASPNDISLKGISNLIVSTLVWQWDSTLLHFIRPCAARPPPSPMASTTSIKSCRHDVYKKCIKNRENITQYGDVKYGAWGQRTKRKKRSKPNSGRTHLPETIPEHGSSTVDPSAGNVGTWVLWSETRMGTRHAQRIGI
jgi:hypothetical protein